MVAGKGSAGDKKPTKCHGQNLEGFPQLEPLAVCAITKIEDNSFYVPENLTPIAAEPPVASRLCSARTALREWLQSACDLELQL